MEDQKYRQLTINFTFNFNTPNVNLEKAFIEVIKKIHEITKEIKNIPIT